MAGLEPLHCPHKDESEGWCNQDVWSKLTSEHLKTGLSIFSPQGDVMEERS